MAKVKDPTTLVALGLSSARSRPWSPISERVSHALDKHGSRLRPALFMQWDDVPYGGKGILARVRHALKEAHHVAMDVTDLDASPALSKAWERLIAGGTSELDYSGNDITLCELVMILATPEWFNKTVFTKDGEIVDKEWVLATYGGPLLPSAEQYQWALPSAEQEQ